MLRIGVLVLGFLFFGALAANVYWAIAGFLQVAVVGPFFLWFGRMRGGFDAVKAKHMVVPVVLATVVTVVSCLVWTILVGNGVLTCIMAVYNAHWAKWLFLALGFGLAIYHPGTEEEDQPGAQALIAFFAMAIGYILNVIFILRVALPNHISIYFFHIAPNRLVNVPGMLSKVWYGFSLCVLWALGLATAVYIIMAISQRLAKARPAWRNIGAFIFGVLSAYSASFVIDIIAVTLLNHVRFLTNLPSMIIWSVGAATFYVASRKASPLRWMLSVPYFLSGLLLGIPGVLGLTYRSAFAETDIGVHGTGYVASYAINGAVMVIVGFASMRRRVQKVSVETADLNT